MPRWASRISLEVTGVRVARVQEISEADARAEGIMPDDGEARYGFALLWDGINAKRGHGWERNPLVWAVEFKLIQRG